VTATAEGLRAFIGWTADEREDAVEAGHLRRFAEAIGDPDARWLDEAPPTFTASFLTEPPPLPPGWDRGSSWLNAGDRFELLAPIRAGDVIRSRTVLSDIYEKSGRSGELLFLVYETEFRDARGRLAVRHRGTRLRR
jgi:hypothetical protein